MQSRPRSRYKTSHNFDHHHEKVALVKLARDLEAEGWPEVRLSVSPARLEASKLDGKKLNEIPVFDQAFIREFDTSDTYRYRFYRDDPGRIDLVARRPGTTLLVEAKGRSARNKRGAIEGLIGRMLLLQRPDEPNYRYAVLIPDGADWDRALPTARPSLEWLELYRISSDGKVTVTGWPPRR